LRPEAFAVLYRQQQAVSTFGPKETGFFNLQASSRSDLSKAGPEIGAKLDRPIVLVGMMGSGKTSVGRRLAHTLDWPFQDADWAIENAAGTTIANIFAEIGEEAFRQSEGQVIARLLGEQDRQVLALGGGSFVAEQTRSLIREKAISIWLNADIETLVRRTSRRDDRPLLRNGDPCEILTRLLEDRRPSYEEADIVVDSGSGSLRDVILRTLQALERFVEDGVQT
jgi:shikimate kinase